MNSFISRITDVKERMGHWFGNIFHNQRIILYMLLAELMFTSCIMLFTEQMNWAGKVCLIIIPLSIQMMLLAAFKRPGTAFLILIPKLIFDAFQFVILVLFGSTPIAVDMFLNVATTNPKESGELLSNIFPAIIFLILFFGFGICMAILSVRNKKALDSPYRKRVAISGLTLLTVGGLFFTAAKNINPVYIANEDLYPYNVFYNLGFAIKKMARVKAYPQTCKDFTFNAKADTTNHNRQIVVLILGETERAANCGMLGYEPNNYMPLDTVANLVAYSNMLTQSNTTHKIVPMLLSPAEASNHEIIYTSKSIVTAFAEAGFKTAFFTNQMYNGSFPAHYYNAADYKASLKDKSMGALDHELLPHLDSLLQKEQDNNLFIILHLYGSHFSYKDRYSDEFAHFLPDKAEFISTKNKIELTNSYNNSIMSTTDLIANVIRRIDLPDAESSLLYLSDHGEDLMDDSRHRFLHASPIPTYYQLHTPFLCWNSTKFINNHQEKHNFAVEHKDTPLSNNIVFHTLLDMAGISTPYFKPELSICSPLLNVGEREYLTDRDGCIKIKELPLHKFDIEKLKEKGMLN